MLREVRGRPSARRLPWGIFLLTAVLACGGEDGVAPELAPMVGTWNATSAVFTNKQNPAQSIDIVKQHQAVITMEIGGDARATLTLIAFGQLTTVAGRARVEGSQLILRPDDPARPEERFLFQLQGNNLTLDGDGEWDFNQDGTPEPSTLRLLMVRS